MTKCNVNFSTAFSGADAVASCVAQAKRKGNLLHWKHGWAAEIKPEQVKREAFKKHYAEALANAECACSVIHERCKGIDNLGDVCQVVNNKLASNRKTDVLIMGPPCQDYSAAGLKKGIKGDVAPLSMDAIKVAQSAKPWVVVIENSPKWKTMHKEFYDDVIDKLKDTHAVKDIILDPRMFNVPYNRERLYVVAVRLGYEAQLEKIVSNLPPFEKRFDRSNVDWTKYLERVASLEDQDLLKQSADKQVDLDKIVLTKEEGLRLIRDRIYSKGKIQGPVGKRVEELRGPESAWKSKEEDREKLDLFIEAMENAEFFLEDSEMEDMQDPMFWADEYLIKMPKWAMNTLMKSGPADRGTFFYADGALKPRLLTATEWEWGQGFQGWWTEVNNLYRDNEPLGQEARKGLMGNSMSIECLRFLIDRIDDAMQPVWQEIADD